MRYLLAIAALALSACASIPLAKDPPPDQYLGSQFGQCPDGIIEVAIYDPAPNDPKVSRIVLFKRGDQVIARMQGDTIYIVKLRTVMPLAEAQAKYGTPCEIPHNGTGM